MARLSRRAFFHAIGLCSGSAEPKPDDVRVPSNSQKREEGGNSDAADVPGTFQFSLMSILVLITVVGILLGVAKTWPTKTPVAAVLAAVVLEWIYRKRIKVALGTKRYPILPAALLALTALLLRWDFGGDFGDTNR